MEGHVERIITPVLVLLLVVITLAAPTFTFTVTASGANAGSKGYYSQSLTLSLFGVKSHTGFPAWMGPLNLSLIYGSAATTILALLAALGWLAAELTDRHTPAIPLITAILLIVSLDLLSSGANSVTQQVLGDASPQFSYVAVNPTPNVGLVAMALGFLVSFAAFYIEMKNGQKEPIDHPHQEHRAATKTLNQNTQSTTQ